MKKEKREHKPDGKADRRTYGTYSMRVKNSAR